MTINGEVFGFDTSRRPMSEALAIEHGLKCTYAQWETDMKAGSARAMCGFIWLVWRRDGRDVKLADIMSGDVEIDLSELNIEPDEGDEDPTIPPPELPDAAAPADAVPLSPSGPTAI